MTSCVLLSVNMCVGIPYDMTRLFQRRYTMCYAVVLDVITPLGSLEQRCIISSTNWLLVTSAEVISKCPSRQNSVGNSTKLVVGAVIIRRLICFGRACCNRSKSYTHCLQWLDSRTFFAYCCTYVSHTDVLPIMNNTSDIKDVIVVAQKDALYSPIDRCSTSQKSIPVTDICRFLQGLP